MLNKLRSRHPVDVPAEGFGRSRGLMGIIGFLAVLFVLIPLAATLVAGLVTLPLAIGLAFAAAFLALVLGAAVTRTDRR